ncbi:MAG: transporter substrate-binding domain-containing protein [Gammaproteobacteria bacterium]|nr:transporter substrate-binding domain-containing protein [Gammaproteobacteria bacterium]
MAFIRITKLDLNPAARFLLLVLVVVFSAPAQAYLNRSYSSLELVREFQGDFMGILAQGKLRLLLTRDNSRASYLPRQGSPLAEQQRIAEEFALSHGLIPELVLVDNFSKLIPALQAGKGDIIISNLTINADRLEKMAFSVPLDHVVEQVLVAKGDKSIQRVRDLSGKSVLVNRDSTFWHALTWLKKNRYPDIEIVEIADGVQTEAVLDDVAEGRVDATILDSNLVEIYLGYRDDLRVATNFSSKRDIAWGIRKNAPQLVNEINRYLQLEYMVEGRDKRFLDDFGAIKKRRVLRVLLRNNAASYFLYRGELMGFEYELAREFAEYHGLRLEVVVPPSYRELNSWLLEGRADMAMGFIEPGRRQRGLGIDFTNPYHYARQHIVVQADDPADSLEALDHRTLFVRHHSSYWDRLSQLQKDGARFNLRATRDNVETEQLIQMVSRGKYKATLADEHLLDIELAKGVAVRSAYALDDVAEHAIALRKRNPELKKALNAFVKRVYKSEFYNVTYRKYFKSQRSVQRLARGRVVDALSGQISPYDDLVRKYSDHYGFDWRLVTAQMYQESKFDPKAKSHVGAKGLMQLMPRTAKAMGVKNTSDPAHSIKGGIKYMDWLRDRFDSNLPISERLWFTLASYNAGAGHVHDARRLASQLGYDPDRWFDHTEHAMLALSKKEYARKARFGYVNGREPVNYVRDIRQRFEAYVELSRNIAELPRHSPTYPHKTGGPTFRFYEFAGDFRLASTPG